MSKKKLAGIIAGSVIGIIIIIIIIGAVVAPTHTYRLTVSASPSGGGSVSPAGGEYESGVQVTLTASPSSGYSFDYWSGSASGTTPTITVAMNSDKTLTANFKATTQSYTLTISISPSATGSVSPSSGEYDPGEQVTLTANPASGYSFDYWSGGASGTTSTITITMDSDKSLTAHFKVTPEVPQTSRTNPAGLYQPIQVEVDDFWGGKMVLELEMLELISGYTAWNMIYEWNMFNDKPEAGQEYIIAKFRVKIVELENEPYDINNAQFDVYSATGVKYTEWVSVAGEDPDLDTSLYEGAEHIGYTSFLVRTDDSPVIVYQPLWDENAIWFDLRAGS